MVREVTNLPYDDKPVGRLWDGQHGNYDNQRKDISMVILHSMDGTTDGSTQWFFHQDTSAHYGVSKDGKITSWIKENCVAYHAGKYSINQISIGIEHEDGGDNQAPRTPEELESSAQLLADISMFYGMPLDRDHVKGHNEIVPTACPGNLPVDDILKRANDIIAEKKNTSAPVVNINGQNVPVAGTPDGKSPVALTQTLFEGLVTKSASTDDVGRFLKYPQDQIDAPGFGKVLISYIQDLQNKANSVAVTQNPPPQPTTPGMSVTTATAPGVASDASNTTQQAPDSQNVKNGLSNQAISILTADILDLLKRVFGKGGTA